MQVGVSTCYKPPGRGRKREGEVVKVKPGSTARKATKAIDPDQQGGDRSLERSIKRK